MVEFKHLVRKNRSSATLCKKPYLLLILAGIVLWIYYRWINTGPMGYDDLHYARLAHNLLTGIFEPGDHYSHRLIPICTTALSFVLLGINDFAAVLPVMLAVWLMCWLSLWMVKTLAFSIQVYVLLGILCSPPILFYSTKLMPDIFVALSGLALFALYKRYHFDVHRQKPLTYASLILITLLVGFMAKSTLFLFAPLLIYLFIMDFFRSYRIDLWGYLAILIVTCAILYFGLSAHIMGHPLVRLDAILSNPYMSFCSYEQQSMKHLFRRVSYQFFEMLILEGMMVGFLVTLPIFAVALRRHLRWTSAASYFMVITYLTALSSNFMSVSITNYAPLCLDPRHYLALVPLSIIASALALPYLLERRSLMVWVGGLSLLCAVVCIYHQDATAWELYIPFSVLCFVMIVAKRLGQDEFVYCLCIVLCIHPLLSLNKTLKYNYTDQKAFVKKHVLGLDSTVILTDEVQKQLIAFYAGYPDKASTAVLSYGEVRLDTLQKKDRVFVLNSYHSAIKSGLRHRDLPYYAQSEVYWDSIVAKDEKIGMRLILLTEEELRDTLLQATLRFDKSPSSSLWKNAFSDTLTLSRLHSHPVQAPDPFSAHLEVLLDSLKIGRGPLFIEGEVSVLAEDETESAIVLSISGKFDENVFWEQLPIQDKLRIYGHWTRVPFRFLLPYNNSLPNSGKLKLYVWNPKKEPGFYIDDFHVRLVSTLP